MADTLIEEYKSSIPSSRDMKDKVDEDPEKNTGILRMKTKVHDLDGNIINGCKQIAWLLQNNY